MLIDLFKDTSVVNTVNRVSNQIETRGFEPILSLSEIHARLPKNKKYPDYVAEIEKLLQTKRCYTKIMSAGCDNLFLLEQLGIGAYTLDYIVTLDFSDCLDSALSSLSGCSPEVIRAIPNYSEISRGIINLDLEILQKVQFKTFFNLDPKLDAFLQELLNEAKQTSKTYSVSNSDIIMHDFVYLFFARVLSFISNEKDYCFYALKQQLEASDDYTLILRSKSYSSVLGTCNKPISEKITFRNSYGMEFSVFAESHKSLCIMQGGAA